MTSVHVHRYLHCPFSAAVELAEKAVARRDGFYLTPSPPLGERVRFAAASTTDTTDQARKHDALLIAWRPQTPHLFPDFRGAVTVRPQHRGAMLRLDGCYEPPFGLLGRVFDVFVGRSIAKQTMLQFLKDLAGDIEREYEKERRLHTTNGETHVQIHPVSH